MPLTPETLTRHELCGLPVRVAAAASDGHVGIAGRVVSESQRTLTIRVRETSREGRPGVRDKQVPKAGATFVFALPASATDSDTGTDDPVPVIRDSSRPTDEARGRESPLATDETRGRESPLATDEAAGARKPPGSTFELPSSSTDALAVGRGQDDTAGVTAGQSGGCEDVVYVTVDGARLLSRPAFRTERAGDSIWQ